MSRRSIIAAPTLASAVLAAPAGMEAAGLPAAQTFNYTGGEQSYVVPGGVTEVQVFAVGANGGPTFQNPVRGEGLGATVSADLPVSGGQTLYVEVGGNGTYSAGGFNGGAPGSLRAGGGGASDVRTCSRTGTPACPPGIATLLAHASYNLLSGHSQLIVLRISRAGLRLLSNARHHGPRVIATATLAGGSAPSRVVRFRG
jgi:hypothetical protein